MSHEVTTPDEQFEFLSKQLASSQVPANLLQKLDRFFNVLRYYRWTKLAGRAKQRIQKATGLAANLYAVAQPLVTCKGFNPTAIDRLHALEKIARGKSSTRIDHAEQVAIAGKIVQLKSPFDWEDFLGQFDTRLLTFQAHYHEFLLEPPFYVEGSVQREAVVDCLSHWIKQFPHNGSSPDAWHPYCISRRLPVWLYLANYLDSQTSFLGSYFESIIWQAESLSKNLEFDPGGNHLMENLTTLATVAATVDSPIASHWCSIVNRWLSSEIERQILPHGEHFECSPMYHLHVLYILLRTAYVTGERFPELSDVCLSASGRMLGFINQILHPDGEIPLLADSVFEETISATKLPNLCELIDLKPRYHDPIPYAILKSNHTWMVFDAGQHGCSWLPAHAQNDLTSFEISWKKKRWIVDSGNYEYQAGKLRDYCRSAIAHNVLTIGNRNHSDVWDSFMMGYRGTVRLVKLPEQQDVQWSAAAHNGYRRFRVPWVYRAIGLIIDDTWFCLDWGNASKANLPLIGYLHFSPSVTLQRVNGEQWLGREGNSQRVFQFFGIEESGTFRYPYCPSFGKMLPAVGLWYRLKKENQFMGGWVSSVDLHGPQPFLEDTKLTIGSPETGVSILEISPFEQCS